MNEVKIFENEEFGKIRTVEINSEPYFVGKDVAEALGYSNSRDAISKHVDAEDKGVANRDTLGGKQNLTAINESGLYSLILSSKLESAKRFKHWVTSDILPTIRKHGMYATDDLLNDPDLAIKAFTALKEERERNRRLIADNDRMKPKEIFTDAVTASKSTILVRDLSKFLKQNGINIGQNTLFEWLRDNKYLISQKGDGWNTPTQKSMNLNLFEVTERTINNPGKDPIITRTTRVTGKGQQYFINKFLKAKEIK